MRVFEWIDDNLGALIVSAIASVFASFGAWLMTIFVAAKFVRGEWSYGVPLAFGIPPR